MKPSIHPVSAPVFCFSSFSLSGEPITASVYYVGDMYQVCVDCYHDDGMEYHEVEYFIHLGDAIAYAETV